MLCKPTAFQRALAAFPLEAVADRAHAKPQEQTVFNHRSRANISDQGA